MEACLQWVVGISVAEVDEKQFLGRYAAVAALRVAAAAEEEEKEEGEVEQEEEEAVVAVVVEAEGEREDRGEPGDI